MPNIPLTLSENTPLLHASTEDQLKSLDKRTMQSIQDLNRDLLMEQLKTYNRETVSRHIRKSRRELKAMDLIDVRGLLDTTTADPQAIPNIQRTMEEIRYIQTHYWYAGIPCFNEGVLQMNTHAYIHYQIEDIKLNERTYVVNLQSYAYGNAGWEPGIYTKVAYIFPNVTDIATKLNCNIPCFVLDYQGYPQYYRLIDAKEFHWNKYEQQNWAQYLETLDQINQYDIKTKKVTDMHEILTRMTESLAIIFINTIPKINLALEQSKPKLAPGQRAKAKAKTIVSYEETKEPPKKKIRVIGTGLTIKSEKPPRPPREETIIRYKIPSWKTRGHIRTYKNGKQVYIKESIHKRRCLTETEPASTTIKFKERK